MGGNGPLPFVVPWHLRGSLITWDSGAGRGEPRESPSRWLLNNTKSRVKITLCFRQRVRSGGAGSVRVPLSMPPPLRCNKPPFGDPMGLNGKDLLHTYCKNTESGDVSFQRTARSRLDISCPSMKLAPDLRARREIPHDSGWHRHEFALFKVTKSQK